MATWSFNPGSGPGAHALVVGVGEYPHLLGGGRGLFSDHEGMGQLTSAPESAQAFASWVVNEYRRASHPLRSLELLISGPQEKIAANRATFANFKAATLRWYQRLQPGDHAMFYFCGHGLGAGYQHTLLLEDYGCDPSTVMSYALDFSRFLVAMARSQAHTQGYLLDACRVASDTLMRSLGTFGDPILTPSSALPTPKRLQSAFYSTLPGDAAYGRPGKTSLFTEALLLAMRGAGAIRSKGRWVVKPSSLYPGLQHHLDHLAAPFGVTQTCLAMLADYTFHELPGLPNVPVVVDCTSPIDLAVTTLKVSGPRGNREQPPPVPAPWRFDLPTGDYQIVADPPGGNPRTEHVYPPVTEVLLP